MAFLEIAGQRRAIAPGESVIGSDPGSRIVLTGMRVAPRHAVLQVGGDGQVAIRRADARAEILVNGIQLGAQPSPLLHGDKIEIGGHELLFVDERRSGSTQYVPVVTPGQGATPGVPARKPTAATGGRLVSLTDGREYLVGGSVVIGREAACDVVVTNKDVSRRHAEIVATPSGYLIVDSSTNGTFVNGQRVSGQLALSRADVIRIGDNEFRFYADVSPPLPRSAPPAAVGPRGSQGALRRLADTLLGVRGVRPAGTPPGSAVPPPRPAVPPIPVEPMRSAPSSPPAPPRPVAPMPPPAAPAPAAPVATRGGPVPTAPRPGGPTGPLAHVVIRSGVLKGQRIAIRTPVVNVGRADYNDIVLPDDSVSTTHAKIQRREGIWVLVDLDSTNGTFADGERVAGEAPLAPGALLRFGDVRAFFEPADPNEPIKGGSTKLIQAVKPPTDSP
jgi:pSer/pThr/pTyr-binding forkhead associated (FHA) protein